MRAWPGTIRVQALGAGRCRELFSEAGSKDASSTSAFATDDGHRGRLPDHGTCHVRHSPVPQAAYPTFVPEAPVELSAGIVTFPHPAVTQPDDLFALVEAALARGKAQVGERVGVAD